MGLTRFRRSPLPLACAIAATSLSSLGAQTPAPAAPATSSPPRAQTPSPSPSPPSSPASTSPARGTRSRDDARTAQEQYAPPVMRFAPDGLTLADAVNLTLRHDPSIKLQQSAFRQQQGAAQEQRGAFDATLSGRLFYEYRLQELPQSTKNIEGEKRTDLQDEINVNRRDYDKAQTLIQQLQAVRTAPAGQPQVDAISAIDPSIGAQLRAIDLLISDQPSASVRDQLRQIRQDYIDRTVAQVQEGAQGLVSGFEQGEQKLINLGPTPRDEVFYNGGFDVQVGRKFRNGLFFAPFVNGNVDGTNFRDKPRSSDFGGKGLQDLFTFKAGLSSTIPLARGRGSDATGAPEKAAKMAADASRFALLHQMSASVLATVRAYWALRAAQAAVEVARSSVALQDRLVELTRASIEAGETAQVELARVQASQARSQARLRDTERSLIDARVALAVAIGVAAEPDDATLPRAHDEFPRFASLAGSGGGDAAAGAPAANAAQTTAPPATPSAQGQTLAGGPSPADVASLLAGASAQRNDAKSTALLEESGRVLRRGAETEMRPRLDVQNTTWFTALDERTVSKALDRWVGPSTDVSLEVEKPFGNNVRRGRFVQADAAAQQRQIDATNLQRQITLAVLQDTQALRVAQARVDQARASVEAYRQTVDAEFERYRSGDATLIDAILTETQQVDARLGLVSAEQDLATLIAQLRFDAGTLVSFTGEQPIVNPGDLFAAPGLTIAPATPSTPPPDAAPEAVAQPNADAPPGPDGALPRGARARRYAAAPANASAPRNGATREPASAPPRAAMPQGGAR